MNHKRSLVPLALALACGTSACEPPLADDVAEQASPIIGGTLDSGDPAVVMVGNWCTGTLVADSVVLTADHCTEYTIRNVSFGSSWGSFFAERRVSRVLSSRYVNSSGDGGDMALLQLAEPAPEEVEPIPLNEVKLDDSWIGAEVRAVGFGVDDGEAQTGFGTKRQVSMLIRDLTELHLWAGDSVYNTCQGDSGGPIFLTIDGNEYVAATTEQGPEGCQGLSQSARVDHQLDFLFEVIDAWSGPCKADGECVTAGCRTPDPDCDPCGFEGTCATGCEKMDLDCPIAGFDGDPCETREDCESLLCIESSEDPRVKYCSQECDPEKPEEIYGCLPPLTSCSTEPDGTHLCRFAGTTPGVQGAECTEAEDCRSGNCFPPGDGICAEPCGGDFGECDEAYACEDIGGGVNACVLPEDEGCCQASPGRPRPTSPAGGLLLIGLLAGLFLARKQRHALRSGARPR